MSGQSSVEIGVRKVQFVLTSNMYNEQVRVEGKMYRCFVHLLYVGKLQIPSLKNIRFGGIYDLCIIQRVLRSFLRCDFYF